MVGVTLVGTFVSPLVGRSVGRSVGWSCRSVGQSVSVCRLVCLFLWLSVRHFVGWSVGWFVCWFVGWMVGRFLGWLVGWFVAVLFCLSVYWFMMATLRCCYNCVCIDLHVHVLANTHQFRFVRMLYHYIQTKDLFSKINECVCVNVVNLICNHI